METSLHLNIGEKFNMLLDFNYIVEKYGNPKGVIHVGAHLMQERDDYLVKGLDNTIWVEADPSTFNQISWLNTADNQESVFHFAASDEDNRLYDFNVTNNGQSSSILKLDKHRVHHPDIHVTQVVQVPSKRMDTLIKENSINIAEYDFINLDVQGAELLVLKGFGNLLDKFKFIYTEVNTNYLYENCALLDEIDDYLNMRGFDRAETSMTSWEWGDALYIKR